jgi:outer membrane usher protein FimD/PapC
VALTEVSEDVVSIQFSFVYQSPDYADRTQKALTLAMSEGLVTGILQESSLDVQKLPEQRLNGVNTTPISSNETNAAESVAVSPIAAPITITVTATMTAVDPEAQLVEEEPSPTVSQEVEADTQTVSRPIASDWVPPGFENLNQPQVTEIDVYYGGYFLTSVLAEFTNQEVTILDTAFLTGQLNNLNNPEMFQAQLNAPLDAHNELLCFSEFQTDCGTLETDSVEIIFDRSLLRMWLFISPDYLEEADSNVVRFLPASQAGLSFMNQSAAYFTTQELSLETYNLFNNTLFAWGENRLSMRSNLVSDEGFDVDTVAFFREFQGKDYRLGLVRENANGFSFMSNERFAGASYASSLLTRTDLERSLGNEIELYFSTRSRVEIYREGRLISSDIYAVGNQLLNTSDLPNGSYTIEIRIIDSGGNETTEERYYSKTANIPPADQPLYFLHIGRLENDLDINRLSRTGDDEVMFRGGISKRLGHTLGGNVGFSVVEDTSFLELGLFKQGQNYELQANAAYENTGASGMDLRLRYRHPRYNLILNGRQVFNGLEESQIGLEYQQYNAMVEFPGRNGYYSIFHRHVERPSSGRNLNSGFRYRSHSSNIFGGMLSNNFELSKNGDEILALWNFNWSIQGNNKTSIYSPTLAYSNEDASRDSGLYGSYETNWYKGDQSGNEYVYSLRGDYDSQSSLEARMQADTSLGTADIMGRYNEVNEQLELNGRLSTSFATTGSATAIGGKRRSESAFLVRVEGDIKADALFNVMVNGSARGQMRADETLIIPVAPYNTYDVELVNVGETLVNLDNRVYRETMYPGNVVNLSWSSQVINIGIGRLVNEEGEPLSNAVIQNVIGIALADSNGVFQAEINQDTEKLEVQQGNFRCIAEFENPRVTDTVLPLGTLVCR